MKIVGVTCLLVVLGLFYIMPIPPTAVGESDTILPLPDEHRSIEEHSRQEFLARLAVIEVDSFKAEALLTKLEDSAEQHGQYSYWECKSYLDYGADLIVEAGILFVTKGSGADRVFCGVASKWSKPILNGEFEWNENVHHISCTATGIDEVVNGRVSGSFNIRSLRGILARIRLRRAGFSNARTIGGTWYYAKSHSWLNTLNADDLDRLSSGGK